MAKRFEGDGFQSVKARRDFLASICGVATTLLITGEAEAALTAAGKFDRATDHSASAVRDEFVDIRRARGRFM